MAIRKSGRKRQPNKKYSIDAFEGISNLIESGSEDNAPVDIDNEKDDEFNITLEPSAAAAEEEAEDDLSMDEGSEKSSVVDPPDDDVDGEPVVRVEIEARVSKKAVKGPRGRRKDPQASLARPSGPESKLHVRGIEEVAKSVAKDVRLSLTFGQDPDDFIPYIFTRAAWSNNTTFPSRALINNTDGGGMHRSFFHTPEMQNREKDVGWRWYYDEGGQSRIQEKQSVTLISALEAGKFIVRKRSDLVIYMGTRNHRRYRLQGGQCLNLNETRQSDHTAKSSAATTGEVVSDSGNVTKNRALVDNGMSNGVGSGSCNTDVHADVEKSIDTRANHSRNDITMAAHVPGRHIRVDRAGEARNDTIMLDAGSHSPKPTNGGGLLVSDEDVVRSKYNGWLLNLGSKIRGLDWKPNENSQTQYLAVAVDQTGPFHDASPFEAPTAPAFTPAPPTPSSLQIWSFEALPLSGAGSQTINNSKHPKLRLILCTEWGDLKSFRWCPMVDRERGQTPKSNSVHLGLLAGIWGDGYLRVIDVYLPASSSMSTEENTVYMKMNSVAFEARPPNSVFTSFTWLSPDEIAASSAVGFLSIFNIAGCIRSGPPMPWFHHCVSETYILNITSAYPSRPHIVFITSMAGTIRTIDLRNPDVDSVSTQRNRLGSASLAWHDHTQSVFQCDDGSLLRLHPLRRLFTSQATANAGAPAPYTQCVATSLMNSTILIGTADGSVIAHNPIRRLMNVKLPLHIQKWFQQEFSRSTTKARELGGEAGGVIRISEGFKVQAGGTGETSKAKELRRKNGETGLITSTIFEEKSCITAVVWNPNEHCAGWAAAGMASGLLRVEDIALNKSG